VFGSCGFLSFSSVFCRFGGRLGPTLYIHFTRRWVKARRHSSALREGEDEKKAEKNAILRGADRGLRLVGWRVRRVGLRLSRLLFALRRLGAAGGTITLRYYSELQMRAF
jgi:hypothetical protein